VDSAGGSLYGGSRRSQSTSSSSSSCSDILSQNDDVQSLYSTDDCKEILREILQHENPVHIAIKLHVTENTFTKWECVLNPVNNILYVAIPEVFPPAMSKQTILSLLEFAEDKLDVDAVVLCLRKNHPDRKILLESFLFMGLEPLSRKSQQAPPHAEKDNEHFYLIYNIED
jgi:ornithine decarboxylase antizyme 1